MFVNTKMDDGPCELVHDEELKEKFEADQDPSMFDSMIERDFLNRISDIDRSIKVFYLILHQYFMTLYVMFARLMFFL